MSPILGIWASQKLVSNPSFESIATVTVGSGGASYVEFTSIPSTYTHLQIRAIARVNNTSDSDWHLRFGTTNSPDTGSNYSNHYLGGNGSTTYAGGSANQVSIYTGVNGLSGMTSNVFGATVTDILDYANTNKYKTVRSLNGVDANGSGYAQMYSGSWRNSGAISYIRILVFSGSFTQYSSFALYGIKAA